jgi:copper(I)-binding protein
MVRLVIIASFALSKFLRNQPVKMMIMSLATMVAQGNLIQVKLSFKDRRLNWISAVIF